VYEILDPETFVIDFFPTHPDSVVFRYTVWGRKTPSIVQDARTDRLIGHSTIAVRSESRRIAGEHRAIIHYTMNQPGPVTVTLHDLLGRQLAEQGRHTWGEPGEEMTISLEMPEVPSGMYFVTVRSENATASARFIYTR
jgi:hypothetical protein